MRVRIRWMWEREYDTEGDYKGWTLGQMKNDASEDIADSATDSDITRLELEVKVLEE